eukprot:6072904-Amphidinium_carterae.1
MCKYYATLAALRATYNKRKVKDEERFESCTVQYLCPILLFAMLQAAILSLSGILPFHPHCQLPEEGHAT